jgi:hypothetical protein
MSIFLKLILLIFVLLSTSSAYAGKIALLPTKTPHLNAKQLQSQMKTFEKNLKSLGGLQIVSSHLVAQTLKSIGISSLSIFDLDRTSISELCEILQSDGLLASQMTLAKGQQKAKFEIKLYACKDPRILEDLILFNGKLKQETWDQISRQSDLLINTMLSVAFVQPQERQFDGQFDGQFDSQFEHQSFDQNHQNHLDHQNHQDFQISQEQANPQSLRIDRMFILSAGMSAFNYTMKYQTSVNSPSQRAGLDFQSQWFIGYQLQLAFQPFSKVPNFLRKFSFFVNYQFYRFQTIQILPRLFDEDELRALDSSLQDLNYGAYFIHPIQRGLKTHLLGLFTKIQSQKIQIDRNLEYRGHAYQAVYLGILGQLCAMPNTFLVDLEVSVLPYLQFDQSIQEFASQSKSFGGQVKFSMHYLLAKVFSIDLQLQGQIISHQLAGAGRGGRLGKEMSEQSLQGMLGFSIYLF